MIATARLWDCMTLVIILIMSWLGSLCVSVTHVHLLSRVTSPRTHHMYYLLWCMTLIIALASHQDERTTLHQYQRKIVNLKTIQLEMLVLHLADQSEELSFLNQAALEALQPKLEGAQPSNIGLWLMYVTLVYKLCTIGLS